MQVVKLCSIFFLLLSSALYAQSKSELANYYAKCTMVAQEIILIPGLNDTNKKAFQGSLDIYKELLNIYVNNDLSQFEKKIKEVAPSVKQMSTQQLANFAEQCATRTNAALTKSR